MLLFLNSFKELDSWWILEKIILFITGVLSVHRKYEHIGVRRERKTYYFCEYCGHKAEKKMLDVHVAMEHTEQGQLEECPHCHVSYHPKFLPVRYLFVLQWISTA